MMEGKMGAGGPPSSGSMEPEIVLEHAIGFAGGLPSGLVLHPNGHEYVCAAGGTVIVADLDDSHQQSFLRGHRDTISVLVLSPSGRYIASGEHGRDADVVVWDFETKEMLYRLSEHDHGVAGLAFSHDERLLVTVGCSDDKRLFVWDLKTGGIVASEKADADTTVVSWGGMFKDIKRRDTETYQFVTAGKRQLQRWLLDPYSGTCEKESIKTTAVRDITCVGWSDDFEFLFAGSTTGDVMAFSIKYLSLGTSLRRNAPAPARGMRTMCGVHGVRVRHGMRVMHSDVRLLVYSCTHGISRGSPPVAMLSLTHAHITHPLSHKSLLSLYQSPRISLYLPVSPCISPTVARIPSASPSSASPTPSF